MPMGTVTSACVAASDRVRPGWSALVAGTHLDRDIRRERSLSRRSGSHVECRDRAAAAEARDISLGAFVQSVLGEQRRLQ